MTLRQCKLTPISFLCGFASPVWRCNLGLVNEHLSFQKKKKNNHPIQVALVVSTETKILHTVLNISRSVWALKE